MNAPRVFCVVVAYRPREAVLRAALDSIAAHATQVIVVDNTEGPARALEVAPARYLPLGRNMGIAAAQNRGIALALAEGADYVWLSDQDTVYPPDFLPRMLAAAASCGERGIHFAALAPAFFDTLAGKVRPFIRHAPFIQAFAPAPGLNVVADAIASGTLIPAQALRTVGPMQEDLFIDWVDTEWCWRARRLHGLEVIAVGDVVIRHALGDGLVAFAGRRITIRSPLRHYYIVRNALYLALHSTAATLPVRLQIGWRALLWTVAYPVIAPERKWDHLGACCRGLLDGLTRRMGQRA
jgi:rhamnosyltransferase